MVTAEEHNYLVEVNSLKSDKPCEFQFSLLSVRIFIYNEKVQVVLCAQATKWTHFKCRQINHMHSECSVNSL